VLSQMAAIPTTVSFYFVYKSTIYCWNTRNLMSEDNVVGIATCYGLDRPGFESRWGQEIFSSLEPHRPALGNTQHPILWVPKIFQGCRAARASWPLTSTCHEV
jgi:hypothetical protein